MTVTTTANSISYAGNGVTTAFAFPFIFFEPTDLVVTLFDTTATATVIPAPVLNGIATYDYTVTGTVDAGKYPAGGTVTFNTAPASGITVIINRAVPALQEVTLIDNTKFPADTVNTEFDKLTVLAQQSEYSSNLALRIPAGETTNVVAGPAPVRATRLLAWDSIGNLIQSNLSLADIEGGVIPMPVPTPLIGIFNVMDYGAVGDGIVDDTAAFNAAFSAAMIANGGLVVAPPSRRYRIASTVIQRSGTTFDGGSFTPGNPVGGTVILADAALAVAWQMGAGGDNGTTMLRNVSISRAGGAPASSSLGIYVKDGYNVQFHNVMSDNHGQCWLFQSHPATGSGISAKLFNCYSQRAVDCHVVDDGWAELYWHGGRMGMNGAGNYAANSYVRLQGGVTGTAGGPNTVKFMGVQFNQGNNLTLHFWEFVNLGAGGVPGVDATVCGLSECHVEGVGTAFFFSDATWNVIDRFHMTNCTFNNPSIPFLALNAATTIFETTITGCNIYTSTFDLQPVGQQIGGLVIAGGRLTGAMNLTSGLGGSTMSLIGVSLGGNITITGPWGQFNAKGCTSTAGAFINNATGAIDIDNPSYSQGDWAPVLKVGGSSAGITASLAAGHFQVSGRSCTVNFVIVLTNKGAGVGGVTIDGLPYPDINDASNSCGGGALCTSINLAVTTGPVIAASQGGTTLLALSTPSAGGMVALTNGHLTNTTTLRGTLSYFIR